MIDYNHDRYSKPDGNGNASSTISHLLAGSKNLPTLPEINLKLIKTCNSGRENIREIADLIKIDPALSLKVMDMYYSGYHGLPKKLGNLENALSMIGIDAIRILVSCSSAASIFEGLTSRNFDLRLFWRHSLKCAFLAELISKEIPNQSPDEAFLAGLFHDIGKLILFTSLPNIYSKLLSDKTDQGGFILKEKKTIGIDHCYLAYRLMDRWQYYPFMADALLYHHYPLEKVAVALPQVKILYLANMMAEDGTPDEGEIFNSAKTLFGFNSDKVEEYLVYAEARLNDAASMLEMDEIPTGQMPTASTGRNDARFNLANEVRDTSLVAYTMQNILRAKDKGSILQIIRQGFQILFGKSDVFFFLYDRDENALVGQCSKEDDFSGLIEGLRLSVRPDTSMLASCLHDKSPVDSFSFQKRSELTIMDFQLIHFAGKEGILCLPMIENNEPAGVIVLGVEKAEYSLLSKQINLLSSFARQCAPALLDKNRKEEPIKETQTSDVGAGVVLSRKIIHEINNPLSVIKNYLKVLGMKLADHDIDHDEIRIINDEINRIVKMLKKFSASTDKAARIVREPVNVNALLLDIIKLTSGSLDERAGIKFRLDNDTSIPDIITERDNLKQVFMNLIKNAVEAMPGGGNIVIKTSYVPRQQKDDGADVAGIPDGRVRISITDDGPGIPDEIRATLFNEFTTSKEGHEGLGLSIVKGIINRLSGSITCESPGEKGASFIIELPLKPAS
jgi:signal transduction histidine kinase/HD-like signal output (HDOD) protein